VDRAAYEKARALEKAGKADEALRAFREAGAVEEVGRLLAAARRYREAGEVLFGSLGVQPAQAGQLEPSLRKRALSAAIWLAKGGEAQVSVELFVALGERQRAVDTLQRAGDQVGAARLMAGERFDAAPSLLAQPRLAAVGGAATNLLAAQKLESGGKLDLAFDAYVQLRRYADAARLARRLGRGADAAQLYADAGLPFEAAECYLEAGDTGKALDNLVRVPRTDARYRPAAVRAIGLASSVQALGIQLEHFLGPFVAKGPQDEAETEAFYLLALLYLRHDFAENAKEVLQKVEARSPGFRDVRELLEGLAAQSRATPMVAAAVLEDAAHHHRKSLPRLPDLDDLPGLDSPGTVAPATVLRSRTLDSADAPLADAPGAAEAFAPGAIIAGRYELEEKVGQGGMAIVFRAHDLELNEDVALKVFTLPTTSGSAVARFKQELKLSRQLVHANIVRLYDMGLHAGHRYISMELLRGESLKERMRRPMPFSTAIDYLTQACRGLQAAHDAGVIHRDVKPDNFFVSDGGVLKVMDFGIAKHHATPGVTVAGSIAGTPQYMSPEQIGNFSAVTHATDLYALGVCAYELFTGAPPFTHPELVPLLMMHVNEAPAPPRKKNPAIPVELEQLILRLLAKDPSQRFPSCAALADELTLLKARLPK
jgi:eukaryotic-like serine/threonine-protein kinase